jgi:hypothetical protein
MQTAAVSAQEADTYQALPPLLSCRVQSDGLNGSSVVFFDKLTERAPWGSEIPDHWVDEACEFCGSYQNLFVSHGDWGWPVCEDCRLGYVDSERELPGFMRFTHKSCRARTDHQERLARVAHHHDCVYFVRPEERPELVKIGRATNLFQRLSSLQTGSASRLVLIATAPSGDLEKHYHALFAASRVRHEWFKLKDSAVADAPGVSPVLGIWDESFLE